VYSKTNIFGPGTPIVFVLPRAKHGGTNHTDQRQTRTDSENGIWCQRHTSTDPGLLHRESDGSSSACEVFWDLYFLGRDRWRVEGALLSHKVMIEIPERTFEYPNKEKLQHYPSKCGL